MLPKTNHLSSNSSLCDGDMASSFRGRGNLVCFYCNKRSNIKYDGLMTRWDCVYCESTNFLDEHGDITDPPVATDSPAPTKLQYAIPRANSPLPSQNTESQLFCATCLKNQHLFTASIAQYEVDMNPRDPDYRQKEKEYYAYRRRLERTYPQVCADCEPRVLNRMKEAGMTAKADHLRRMMDKSRARRSQKQSVVTKSNLIQRAGQILWYSGLLGQLSWSAFTLAHSTDFGCLSNLDTLAPGMASFIEAGLVLAMSTVWARNSIWCSVLGLWWNPMFSQMKKGFVNHIVGFGEWYKLQILMIISRTIFYTTIQDGNSGVLADPKGTPIIGAHIVMFLYILFLARKSQRSLRVDMSPLWQATPERLINTTTRSHQLQPQKEESLADVLDSIASDPPHSPSRSSRNPNHSSLLSAYITPQAERSQRPLALQDSPASSVRRRELVTTDTMTRKLFQNLDDSGPQTPVTGEGDEMDWTPAQPMSEHRAFRSTMSPETSGRAFGEAPVAEKPSPFWFKTPPAPTTPAQRLRNPPNQPRLRAIPSQEKENFFHNLTRKNVRKYDESYQAERERREMELRQPKFFVPPPKSEARDSLADMLTSFSLRDPQTSVPPESRFTFRWGHFGQFLLLTLGLWFWNRSFSQPHDGAERVRTVVMVACLAIAGRTILDHLILEAGKKSQISTVFALLSGTLEIGLSIYGIAEIVNGMGNCINCSLFGTILVGAMLVQEFWYAAFG